ncbi:MAG TPA: BON domain-containing protein [Chthoniobacterales bacterium]|jgi:osmotically-inducible protein OsmY
MKILLSPILGALLFVYSSQGQQPNVTPSAAAASGSSEADNTKRNSAEENKNTDTAEKQSNNKDDLALTQKIRQEVVKDGSLSMNAKNIKIIVREGKVMLRGPVDSKQEKDTIGAKAGQIAGPNQVNNQLEVKGK